MVMFGTEEGLASESARIVDINMDKTLMLDIVVLWITFKLECLHEIKRESHRPSLYDTIIKKLIEWASFPEI